MSLRGKRLSHFKGGYNFFYREVNRISPILQGGKVVLTLKKFTFNFFFPHYLYFGFFSHSLCFAFFPFLCMCWIFRVFHGFSFENYLNFSSFEKLFRMVKRPFFNSLCRIIWNSPRLKNYLEWSNYH